MRLALTALVLTVAFAPSATAAPRSLAHVPEPEESSFALAGPAVLLSHASGRTVRVDRLPLTAGAPRTTVFRRRTVGVGASAFVSASDQLAAVAVLSAERKTFRLIAEEFAGSPLGPWTALGPPRTIGQRRFGAAFHEVEDDRLFTAEFSLGSPNVRWVVREPAAEPRTLRLPRNATFSAVAGDLLAYATPAAVVVEDWRTGARVARYATPRDIEWLDLRADGALVTADRDGTMVARLPGAAPRRLARGGAGPAFAGDRIVFIDRAGRPGVVSLYVAEPDGQVRRFGVPSHDLATFVADEQRVLWRGNGCLLTAPITEPAADAPDPGACPRSEVHVPDEYSRKVKRDRRVRLRMDCVAAAPPGCQGTLRLRPAFSAPRLAKPRRFRIAVGERARLNVRLTRRGYKAVVRSDREIGGAPVFVRTVIVDPDGRRQVQQHHLVIDVR
jgi:hypothetical protein